MEQINDIKPIMLGLPINISNTILFIFFLAILYFLWINFNNKKELKPEINFWKVTSLEDFKKDLKELEKKYLKESKDIFYPKLSEILKNIFEYKTQKDISKLTLSEIKKQKLNPKSIDLISNIYFKEYAKKIEDSEEIRIDLIGEIKNLIR